MKRLILIPCSNAKLRGGSLERGTAVTAAGRLEANGVALLAARAELGTLLGEAPAPDLGGEGSSPSLLPAMRRYTGRIYKGAGVADWDGATRRAFQEEALIVSGLYGLLTPGELIRQYDCCMERVLTSGERVKSWWRRRGLGRWLEAYVRERGITDVYSFLPAGYEYALDGLAFAGVQVHRTAAVPGYGGLFEQGRALARLARGGVCGCENCRDRPAAEAEFST